MNIVFDTVNVYYLPQFLPICEELTRRGHQITFVCYKNKNSDIQSHDESDGDEHRGKVATEIEYARTQNSGRL